MRGLVGGLGVGGGVSGVGGGGWERVTRVRAWWEGSAAEGEGLFRACIGLRRLGCV
jgi:hypothetical protein